MKIMERKRYTFWDVLGDIGGFHDGVILVLYFMMAPYSAKAFFNKFSHNTPYLEKNRSTIKGNTLSKNLSQDATPQRLNSISFQILEQFS